MFIDYGRPMVVQSIRPSIFPPRLVTVYHSPICDKDNSGYYVTDGHQIWSSSTLRTALLHTTKTMKIRFITAFEESICTIYIYTLLKIKRFNTNWLNQFCNLICGAKKNNIGSRIFQQEWRFSCRFFAFICTFLALAVVRMKKKLQAQ